MLSAADATKRHLFGFSYRTAVHFQSELGRTNRVCQVDKNLLTKVGSSNEILKLDSKHFSGYQLRIKNPPGQ